MSHAKHFNHRQSVRLFGMSSFLAMLIGGMAAFTPAAAEAQGLAPREPYADYKAWVNARKAGPYPDNRSTIPTGRDASLSPAYDVFWHAVLRTEAGGNHFGKDGIPIPGWADKARYGNNIISIGASQARYDTGSPPAAFQEAQPYSPFLRGQSWDLRRYIWDPTYNAAIGYGYYAKIMSNQAGNNPCLAYVGYNAGPGFIAQFRDSGYKPVSARHKMVIKHLGNFIANAKRLAGPHAEEVNRIIETTPGCMQGMDDVDPLPNPTPEDLSSVEVLGYCDPRAIEMLTTHYEAQQRDLDDTLEPLFAEIKRPYASGGSIGGGSIGGGSPGGGNEGGGDIVSSSLGRMGSCVSLSWPNVTFQAPTMDQILRGAEREIIRRACEEARSSVAGMRSKLHQRFYINTRLPGVRSVGVSLN